jgi:hypothetical protein
LIAVKDKEHSLAIGKLGAVHKPLLTLRRTQGKFDHKADRAVPAFDGKFPPFKAFQRLRGAEAR